MSVGTPKAENDWTALATRGELMSVKIDLERKIEGVAADLGGKVKDVRVELANLGRTLDSRIGDVRAVLGERIDKQSQEISKLRVSLAWMTVAVVAVLGGLMTLIEFLS